MTYARTIEWFNLRFSRRQTKCGIPNFAAWFEATVLLQILEYLLAYGDFTKLQFPFMFFLSAGMLAMPVPFNVKLPITRTCFSGRSYSSPLNGI